MVESNEVMQKLKPIELSSLSEDPLVSVLIANYNYADFVGDAIKSVLQQTYPNFEIIVCDDGSTDNSVGVIKSYVERDSRVHLVTKENGGMASALNVAYQLSNGEIICLLDSDDLFESHKLSEIVDAFRKNPKAGFVIHPVLFIDAYGKPRGVYPLFAGMPSGWYGEKLLTNGGCIMDVPPCSGLCLHRDVVKEIFPLNEQFKKLADGIVTRLAPFITEINGLDIPLSRRRFHESNLTPYDRITPAILNSSITAQRRHWEEQKRFLQRLNPQIAESFAPIERHFYFLFLKYKLARLEDKPNWKQLYKLLITHEEFNNQPYLRRLFWRSTGYMGKSLFKRAVLLMSTGSYLRYIISLLTGQYRKHIRYTKNT